MAYLVRSWPRLSQTFVVDEVLALERLGLAIRVFALAASGERLVQPEAARLRARVRCLDGQGRRAGTALADHVRVGLASPWSYLQAGWAAARGRAWDRGYHAASRGACFGLAVRLAAQLRREGRAGQPVAHLHAHFAHDPAAVAALTHRLTGIPWSFTAHARDLYQVEAPVLAGRVASARAAVTCSAAGAAHLRGVVPEALRERVRLVHHGVDVEAFQPAQPPAAYPPRIVAVGRLVPKKGFSDLLAACARLRREGQELTCTIYGDGPERERLAADAGRLGLAGAVRLAGARTRRELLGELRRAEVFALTPVVTADGDRDGIPNALLEAMACGLPLVTTDAGGIGEVVVDGVNGLVARAGDIEGIASRLAALLGDGRLRARLGEAARATVVERFDARDGAAQLAALFGALLGEPAKEAVR